MSTDRMREVILRLRREGGEINVRMTDVPRDDAADFLTMLVINGWIAPGELGLDEPPAEKIPWLREVEPDRWDVSDRD